MFFSFIFVFIAIFYFTFCFSFVSFALLSSIYFWALPCFHLTHNIFPNDLNISLFLQSYFCLLKASASENVSCPFSTVQKEIRTSNIFAWLLLVCTFAEYCFLYIFAWVEAQARINWITHKCP